MTFRRARCHAALFASLAVLALAVTACGNTGEDDVAADPGPPAGTKRPTAVPAAPGQVGSRTLATVLDDGSGPELCLGPVAESYPPQCGGPQLVGWEWSEHDGLFEQQGDTRWGTFAVTGTWDGTSLTVTGAIAGALYDPAPVDEPTPASPSVELSRAELREVADDVGDLPGAQSTAVDGDHVVVDVLYDDGTLQRWADDEHGVNVVLVAGQLRDEPA